MKPRCAPCARGRSAVSQSDLEESVETVIAGYQRKNAVLSSMKSASFPTTKWATHWWPPCRATTAPVTKITIVPRTSGALGYTMQVDQDDKKLLTREELLSKIAVLTGGRAAEEVVFGQVTTGASNDIEQASQIGPRHDHALRHVRRIRHGGHGDGQQPVPGRRHLAGLFPGHGHGHRPAGGGRGARPARQGRVAFEEQHGFPQPRGEYLYREETITGEQFMRSCAACPSRARRHRTRAAKPPYRRKDIGDKQYGAPRLWSAGCIYIRFFRMAFR